MLELVFISFFFWASSFGTNILATNQILIQFLHIFAYALDGFAFAGEVLVGISYGKGSISYIRKSIKNILLFHKTNGWIELSKNKNEDMGMLGVSIPDIQPKATEQKNEIGEELGKKGHEFGTNTGRKRRCGWIDAVMVRHAIEVGGIDGIALTKLDVLDGFETIKICIGYELDGEIINYLPIASEDQFRIKPIYEDVKGWSDSTYGARSWNELPAEAIKYVKRLEELVGCSVSLLSTSPEREDTILVKDPFED